MAKLQRLADPVVWKVLVIIFFCAVFGVLAAVLQSVFLIIPIVLLFVLLRVLFPFVSEQENRRRGMAVERDRNPGRFPPPHNEPQPIMTRVPEEKKEENVALLQKESVDLPLLIN